MNKNGKLKIVKVFGQIELNETKINEDHSVECQCVIWAAGKGLQRQHVRR